ncbi:hypothetical protein HRG_002019 [Hirsutella rhossiliensis]|uniref:Uncharacterized protein n=1 Tax=Hirsutella rhossiliensis TaxID=111463 RepID=A0A9P8N4C2_9HYPO|nr:uncharacterized protein HRG_02019 [Hirsutella rhossiliensis]KAH0966610.1 hypothetical protein HRG_02019 [Hirsutella rhossiliensis]
MPDSASISSASSTSSTSSAPAAAAPANGFGDKSGIKFQIKTGNTRWICTLQDRGSYERMKAARAASSSVSSSTTSSPPTSP